ncbi:LytR/AlgR family response regulator transcription factor [Bacteroidota bacterium]
MIRTLIIEDEQPAAERLSRMLIAIEPSIEILAMLDSVEASVKWLNENTRPDLIMLDIQLADGLSFDIFKKTTVDSFVIFTTAYDEYAIKAFELNSIDYLLKPIDKTKLEKSIRKYQQMKKDSGTIDIQSLMETLENRKANFKKRFAVNIGSRIVSVETSAVSWFYTLEKSTYLCTDDDRHYPLDFSLEHLEELLDPDQFFRINRQYLVGYSAIQRIHILSKSRIKLEVQPSPKEDLLVSTARSHEFRLWLDR